LGHYLLHRTADNIFIDASSIFYRDATSADGSKRQEIEANSFASELLMPEVVIRERLGNHPLGAFDDSTIRNLAEELNVSVQALTIRLTQLSLIHA
jgi:Zn-dependent peptidase ImmA (M78 family)